MINNNIFDSSNILFSHDFSAPEAFSLDTGNVTGSVVLRGLTVAAAHVHTGDVCATVHVEYADGSADSFPLVVGESLWWGDKFVKYPEPFLSHAPSRETLWASLRLYPRQAVSDAEGYFLALGCARKPIARIALENGKGGPPLILGVYITDNLPAELAPYALPAGDANADAREVALRALEDVSLSTKRNFPDHFEYELPQDYTGPVFRFTGDRYAEFFTNAIHFNLDDAAKKLDADGYSHTSTLGAPWYGYDYACGIYTSEGRIYPDQKPGFYYAECWTRDLGRTAAELVRFGRGEHAKACAEWVFSMIRHWEDEDAPLWRDAFRLPRHVQRILQRYETRVGHGCFENDGHALITLFVWEIWRRLPDGGEWVKSHIDDIRALGNWYVWQFEHPELSGATDILWSDSEASGWDNRVGASFYVEIVSREALLACAELTRAAGLPTDAERFEALAAKMKAAIFANYPGETPDGVTWQNHEAWGGQTNIAHIILGCDRGHMDIYRNDAEFTEYDRVAALRNARKYNGDVGGGMGYCQAFTLQSALLSDDMESAEKMLRDTARMIWHPVTQPYIVPENVIRSKRGAYVRIGDLGNSVQQSEILKALRIVVGISDNVGLEFIPRIPASWSGVSVKNYPVLHHGHIIDINFSYNRVDGREIFELGFPEPTDGFTVRVDGGRRCDLVSGAGGKPEVRTVKSGGADRTFARIPGGGTAYKIIFS